MAALRTYSTIVELRSHSRIGVLATDEWILVGLVCYRAAQTEDIETWQKLHTTRRSCVRRIGTRHACF